MSELGEVLQMGRKWMLIFFEKVAKIGSMLENKLSCLGVSRGIHAPSDIANCAEFSYESSRDRRKFQNPSKIAKMRPNFSDLGANFLIFSGGVRNQMADSSMDLFYRFRKSV